MFFTPFEEKFSIKMFRSTFGQHLLTNLDICSVAYRSKILKISFFSPINRMFQSSEIVVK